MTRFTPSRRTVLVGAAATTAALAAPITLRAQPAFVRKNLAAPEAARDVDSYRRGVAAMLALPPDHPHNWYRNAVIHLMDCPHGNWWFTVWHRGYLGYFERIIRKLSEDPEFALPYWDWTLQPKVMPSFFSGPEHPHNALDPSSDHYVDGFAAFEADYKDAFAKMFAGFTPAQIDQLSLRLSTQTMQPGQTMDFETFWNGWNNSVGANFVWNRATSRSKTPDAPDLTDSAAKDVRRSVINTAIAPKHFVLIPAKHDENGNVITPARAGFNSVILANHHGMSRSQATLEAQPHNQVHNNLGFSKNQGTDEMQLWGIMPSNLSSCDPLFFMHHGNVDRIWDVWTRKQENRGLPAGPLMQADLYHNEEFLFFLDEAGDPVTAGTTAKSFMDTARFGYGYSDGTGSDQVGGPLIAGDIGAVSAMAAPQAMFTTENAVSAPLALPQDFTASIPDEAASHVANVSFVPPDQVFGVTFNVFVSPKGEAPEIGPDSPELASSFQFFGMLGLGSMMGDGEPVTVSVDISDALDRLQEAGRLGPDGAIDVTIAADAGGDGALESLMPVSGELKSVTVEAI